MLQANGSAEGAESFSPVGYTTSEDPRGQFPGDKENAQAIGQISGGGRRVVGALLGSAAMGAPSVCLGVGVALLS